MLIKAQNIYFSQKDKQRLKSILKIMKPNPSSFIYSLSLGSAKIINERISCLMRVENQATPAEKSGSTINRMDVEERLNPQQTRQTGLETTEIINFEAINYEDNMESRMPAYHKKIHKKNKLRHPCMQVCRTQRQANNFRMNEHSSLSDMSLTLTNLDNGNACLQNNYYY